MNARQLVFSVALAVVATAPNLSRAGSHTGGDFPNAYVNGSTESADQAMSRMVAEYGRAELDRGGWDNPYLANVSLGNPMLAASIGSGVTQTAATVQHGKRSADEQLTRYVARYQHQPERGAWSNPYLPPASGTVEYDSADYTMARIVGDYDRETLDRGGWTNPFMPSGAAGDPLVATAIGSGVTTRPATPGKASADERLETSVAFGEEGATADEGSASGEPESTSEDSAEESY